MSQLRLLPIEPRSAGIAADVPGLLQAPNFEQLKDTAEDVVGAQQALYARTGATNPWIGYFAVDQATGQLVGSCSFVGPPQNGSVEIAYFTFPPFEGRGIASAMAAAIVAIARASASVQNVHAFTLPVENASVLVLRRIGFERTGVALDDEAGEVWRWELAL